MQAGRDIRGTAVVLNSSLESTSRAEIGCTRHNPRRCSYLSDTVPNQCACEQSMPRVFTQGLVTPATESGPRSRSQLRRRGQNWTTHILVNHSRHKVWQAARQFPPPRSLTTSVYGCLGRWSRLTRLAHKASLTPQTLRSQ